MKIGQVVLKEELTWSDVQVKYSGNTLLLQMIMQAGLDPRNQVDGKTDWGAAIDVGSATYQKHNNDQQLKRDNQDKKKARPKSDKSDPEKKSVGAQLGNKNAYKGGVQSLPGLRDLPSVDFTNLRTTATTSYALGRALANTSGNKIDRKKMAASKKNPNNKL